VFKDVSSLVEGIISRLGLTFLLSGFLPLMVGVAINQYVFFAPAFAEVTSVWNMFPDVVNPWLGVLSGEALTTILLAFALALVLVPLNLFVIRLFEGLLPGIKWLLYPFFMFQRRKHAQHYAPVDDRRGDRRRLLARYEEEGDYDEEADFAIQSDLDHLHAQREKTDPIQTIPFDVKRLAPTRFGNAWAVMEEYPLVRYGMDGMFFWPYLRTVLMKHNSDLLAQIDNQKLLIDVVMHFALVTGVVGLEGLVLGLVRSQPSLLVLALGAAVVFWLFYQAGVSYARTMGMLVGQSYDLYRLHLLDAFGLARPADLDEEYWVWMRLNAFLRRGDPFYFDMLARVGEPDEPGKS
jgi:hypothetical protein